MQGCGPADPEDVDRLISESLPDMDIMDALDPALYWGDTFGELELLLDEVRTKDACIGELAAERKARESRATRVGWMNPTRSDHWLPMGPDDPLEDMEAPGPPTIERIGLRSPN